uniref:Uncharacterized protein n=1 Tax=Anguilla anguilla TaxID=7936 RepID=A0A0E9V6R7_ANGAN
MGAISVFWSSCAERM